MSGYSGYSMSNNAVDAYNFGEMPLSKWTKTKFLDRIASDFPEKLDVCKKLTIGAIKEHALTKTSWHHTSNHFNKTDFYSIDEDFIETLTADKIKELNNASVSNEVESETFIGNVSWLEWSGTRKHPKATEYRMENIEITEKGSFYYFRDKFGFEIKKKIGSNGTRVEKIRNADSINNQPKPKAKLIVKHKENDNKGLCR